MESGDSARENAAANPEPVESGLAAGVNRHQTHPLEMKEQDQQTLLELLDCNHQKSLRVNYKKFQKMYVT